MDLKVSLKLLKKIWAIISSAFYSWRVQIFDNKSEKAQCICDSLWKLLVSWETQLIKICSKFTTKTLDSSISVKCCSRLIFISNQLTGFFMKYSTELEWVSMLSVFTDNYSQLTFTCSTSTTSGKKMWNMFKVNKDKRTTSITSLWCFYC